MELSQSIIGETVKFPESQQVVRCVVATLLFLGLASVVSAADYAPNEVFVKPRPPATIQTVVQNENIDKIRPIGEAGWYLVHSPTEDTPTLLSRLSARSDVEGVEPNWVIHLEDDPHSVPALSAPAIVGLALMLSALGSLLALRQPRPSKR